MRRPLVVLLRQVLWEKKKAVTCELQVQGLEDVAVLSVLGSVGMLLSVIIATIKLVLMESEVKHTELIHKPDTFSTPIVAILDIVFTYGGQASPATFAGGEAVPYNLFAAGQGKLVADQFKPPKSKAASLEHDLIASC